MADAEKSGEDSDRLNVSVEVSAVFREETSDLREMVGRTVSME